MTAIELSAYGLAPLGSGNGLFDVDLALEEGDVVAVEADNPEDGRLLLRGLATLTAPVAGAFRFDGKELDFSDYRRLLPTKRKIGYMAADAAMLSNRTLRQNILTMRYYFENSLSIDLDPDTAHLCRKLGIERELDRLPAQVDSSDLHRAIAVRELSKAPMLVLLDRPEETIGQAGFRKLLEQLETPRQPRPAWVCTSRNRRFLETWCTGRIRIRNGALSTEPLPGRPLDDPA